VVELNKWEKKMLNAATAPGELTDAQVRKVVKVLSEVVLRLSAPDFEDAA